MLNNPTVKTIAVFGLIIGFTVFLLGVTGQYDQGAPQEGMMQRFFKFD